MSYKSPKKIECRYGMSCCREDCYFEHPKGWKPRVRKSPPKFCHKLDHCSDADCKAMHPNRLCKKDEKWLYLLANNRKFLKHSKKEDYICPRGSECSHMHLCKLEYAGWKCPRVWDDPVSGKIVCRYGHGFFHGLKENPPRSAIADELGIVLWSEEEIESLERRKRDSDKKVEEEPDDDEDEDDEDDEVVDVGNLIKSGVCWGDL